MKLTPEKRKQLKDVLGIVSSDTEKVELNRLDTIEMIDKLEEKFSTVLGAFGEYQKSVNKHHANTIGAFSQFSEMLSKKLEETGGKITTSYEKNKPFNAAGVYKDMINEISNVSKAVEKNRPVWNWPQYASVGVRNTSFRNVNPSVDLFNIGSCDDIQLAYNGSNISSVTYFLNGATVAVLTLSYSGSNLTEVKRTT